MRLDKEGVGETGRGLHYGREMSLREGEIAKEKDVVKEKGR